MLKVSGVVGGPWVWVALVSLLQNVCTTWGGFVQPAHSAKYLHNLVEPASFAEYFHNLKKVFTTCNFCRIFAQPCTSCTTCRVFAQPENGLYNGALCTFCRIFAQPAEVVGAMCTHGLVMIGATSLSILSAPPPPCHRPRGRLSPPLTLPLLHELFKDAWLVDMWSKFRNICNCHLDKSAVQTMHLKPDC